MAERVLAKRAAAKALAEQVAATELARKEQIAAEGLVKLMNSPPKPAISTSPKDAVLYARNLQKQQKNWEVFIKKRAQQLTTQHAIAELFTIGQLDLALLMFGPERTALWETNYSLVRDIFEIAPIPSQCNNTIGPFVPGKTPCWICGMVIPYATEDMHCGYENGLAGECEHILPVAQAAIFLQLYDKVNKASDLFNLEYAWSHKLCNRTKNDDVYFRPELAATGIPVIDDKQFDKLLTRIYNSDRTDATCAGHPKHSFKDLLQKYVGKDVKGWKSRQNGEFVVRYGKIVKFIGGPNFRSSPELYILALAAAPASIVNRLDETRRATLGYGGKRRTRRRRHQSIKMSSRRHSLSGKPAKR
jgi:hypothetical protein